LKQQLQQVQAKNKQTKNIRIFVELHTDASNSMWTE